jgi:hypothetical protein
LTIFGNVPSPSTPETLKEVNFFEGVAFKGLRELS